MKYSTIFDYPHTGTLRRFTESTSPSGAVIRNYFNDGEIKCKLIPQRNIGKPVLYTDIQLQSFERVVDIVDADGKPILLDGISGYEINAVYPVINPMGIRDAFSYTLTRLVD